MTSKLAGLSLCALLAACGGGGGGGVPSTPGTSVPTVPQASPTPPGASSQTIVTAQGSTAGAAGFTPSEGDTASGGQGNPVDGINCETSMAELYHVHAYLMVLVNGAQVQIPAGTGMANPQPPVNGFVNAASCFYHIHTHDASGIIHVEDPNPNNLPVTAAMYSLKTYLDIWGITADANHFGQFSGPVRVFTSPQTYAGQTATISASSYSYAGSDPNVIPLYSHEVIVVEVGPNFPAPGGVPNVNFYVTN